MQIRMTVRARRAVGLGAAALGLLAAAACDNPQDTLLEQQHPEVIAPADVNNNAGALALYTGALGRFKVALNGGNQNQEDLWNFEGLFTDEFKSGDTFSQRNDADQRVTQTGDAVLAPTYNAVQTSRGRARDAINALKQYAPTETAKIAEMYFEMGFMEMTLGQAFCNGIPLGETVAGVPVYTNPLTNSDVFLQAIARFDTANTILGSDASTAGTNVRNAVLLAKARAQVDLGQFSAAAALVGPVPTSYQYEITYSVTTQSNEWWQMSTSSRRYVVGDSFDVAGVIAGAIPFASLKDPRVKAVPDGKKAFDNITPFVEFQNFAQAEAAPLVSGVDARLIEAEAKLQSTGTDIPGAFAILNALRAAPPRLSGTYTPPAMAALAVPSTLTAAQDAFFREKALWQFGRGERISDLRRLVRQYGRSASTVYPTGAFHKGGNYGQLLSFPTPDAELSNPNFKGCLDLKA